MMRLRDSEAHPWTLDICELKVKNPYLVYCTRHFNYIIFFDLHNNLSTFLLHVEKLGLDFIQGFVWVWFDSKACTFLIAQNCPSVWNPKRLLGLKKKKKLTIS